MFQSLNSGYPDTRLWPIFRIIYSGPLMAVVPPLSLSPRFPRPSSMSSATLPVRAYLSPPLASFPSVVLFSCLPPSSAGCHPPSARTDWRPVPCCSCCPFQCPDGCGRAPPDLCGWRYLARVLVEGLRRRRPRNGLESLVSLPGVARVACLLQRTLEFPLDSCGARETAPPAMVLSLSSRRQASPG